MDYFEVTTHLKCEGGESSARRIYTDLKAFLAEANPGVPDLKDMEASIPALRNYFCDTEDILRAGGASFSGLSMDGDTVTFTEFNNYDETFIAARLLSGHYGENFDVTFESRYGVGSGEHKDSGRFKVSAEECRRKTNGVRYDNPNALLNAVRKETERIYAGMREETIVFASSSFVSYNFKQYASMAAKWNENSLRAGAISIAGDGRLKVLTKHGPLELDGISDMSEGFRVIKRNGKYNYMDKDGTVLCNSWLDAAGEFKNGKAKVSFSGQILEIDKEGTVVSVGKTNQMHR